LWSGTIVNFRSQKFGPLSNDIVLQYQAVTDDLSRLLHIYECYSQERQFFIEIAAT